MLFDLDRTSRHLLLLLLAMLLIVLVGERVRHTSSDPRGTLLVSEAIIHHGTIKLDHLDKPTRDRYGYVFYEKNGHFYNYFPLGSAVLSVPVVAIANAVGINMLAHEPIVQMAIVALIGVSMLLVLFATAQMFLSVRASLLLVAIAWFGSSYTSTVGTALWSHDFSVLFASLAIFFVLRSCLQQTRPAWFWVATCMSIAYFCRPTLALLVPFLMVFWSLYDWRSALKATLGFMLWMLAFMLFSTYEYGQLLPDYYLPKRLESDTFELALVGNMVSPARGLLVYSPMLFLLVGLIPLALRKNVLCARLILIALAWPLAHWIVVSRFPHWWAGWSFGARLMTDAMPGLVVGLFAVYAQLSKTSIQRFIFAFVLVSGALAIYINTAQGVFNRHSVIWNTAPNIDQHPEYLFDWRYPPFLHTEKRHQRRLEEFNARGI